MLSCAHLVPANWRAFEGDLPPLKALVTSSLSEMGLSIIADQETKRQIVTQWKYSRSDALSRERSRILVSWEPNEKDNSMVIYVRHENQSIESSMDGGLSYSSLYPDQDLQTSILDRITTKIVNSSK